MRAEEQMDMVASAPEDLQGPVIRGGGTLAGVAVLRMFASAREAAGTGSDVIEGATVGEVLDLAVARYGSAFDRVLATCRVWVNGEAAGRDAPVRSDDEVAVLPPVSGGS